MAVPSKDKGNEFDEELWNTQGEEVERFAQAKEEQAEAMRERANAVLAKDQPDPYENVTRFMANYKHKEPTEDDLKAERKRRKRAALYDGLIALANFGGAAFGATPVKQPSLSKAQAERYEYARKIREAREEKDLQRGYNAAMQADRSATTTHNNARNQAYKDIQQAGVLDKQAQDARSKYVKERTTAEETAKKNAKSAKVAQQNADSNRMRANKASNGGSTATERKQAAQEAELQEALEAFNKLPEAKQKQIAGVNKYGQREYDDKAKKRILNWHKEQKAKARSSASSSSGNGGSNASKPRRDATRKNRNAKK